MRPPKCVICNRTLRDNVDFARVNFTLSQGEAAYTKEMRNRKPPIIGWSVRGEAWFCEFHIEAAKNNKDLSQSEAIKKIKNDSASKDSRAN